MHNRIRVAVIDDHPLFRGGVVHTLQSAADMEVVGEGATAPDAVRLGSSHLPDIMLLDVSMPGGGIEAAREIRHNNAIVKTVLLTVSENEHDVVTAMQIGVNGYVLKGTSGPELLQILRAVQNGESYITPALGARLLTRSKPPVIEVCKVLTRRENQVLQLLSQGLKNKEIAHDLQLTEKTVKHHMTVLMQKLKARNRVEAVLIHAKQMVIQARSLVPASDGREVEVGSEHVFKGPGRKIPPGFFSPGCPFVR
jgi:two-component system nitrate/nitrite response regulator NarL